VQHRWGGVEGEQEGLLEARGVVGVDDPVAVDVGEELVAWPGDQRLLQAGREVVAVQVEVAVAVVGPDDRCPILEAGSWCWARW